MNTQQFIDAIKFVVIDNSIEAVQSLLTKPPGKKPAQK